MAQSAFAGTATGDFRSRSGCTCALMPRVSATSMKMIGSSGSCGWKKAKQRRSGSRRARRSRQPVDRVPGLLLDQLREHDRGGAQVDALQAQEPAVEQGAQQVHQVVVDHPPMRMRLHALEELAAHLHQGGGAAGRHVETAENLLPRRLDGLLQPREIGRRRVGLIVGGRARYRLRRGRVVPRQHVEEVLAGALVERLAGGERVARERRARVLAALGEQGLAKADELARAALDRALAAAEQLPQERGRIHAAALASASMRSASAPATRSRSSRYLSSTPSVLLTVSGSSATRSSATRQLAQSMVSA